MPAAALSGDHPARRSDGLDTARGVCLGVAVCGVFWAALFVGAWRVFWH